MVMVEHPSLTRLTIKIETYWNVNKMNMYFQNFMQQIKIETYWNVNAEEKKAEPKVYELKQKHIGM